MAQSIKSLRKSVVNLQRKVNKEKRRQELVVGLHQTILSLGEEMSALRATGSADKLYETAQASMYRHEGDVS